MLSFLDPPGYFVWCQFYYCISSRTALRCCLPFTHERGADRPIMHESLCSQKNIRGLLVSIPPLLVGGRRGACVDYSSASSRLGIEMFVPHTGILHCHRLLASNQHRGMIASKLDKVHGSLRVLRDPTGVPCSHAQEASSHREQCRQRFCEEKHRERERESEGASQRGLSL